MALIKCNECGHEVSDKASACPNCGCPIADDHFEPQNDVEEAEPVYYYEDDGDDNRKKWLWAVIALLLVVVGGGGYSTEDSFK